MRVSAGQPLKAVHINDLDTRLDAIQQETGTTSPSTGYPFTQRRLYTPLPDFTGTLTPDGHVSVYPGLIYVDGVPVTAPALPQRECSIVNYATAATHPATIGIKAYLSGYYFMDPRNGLDAEFRIIWSAEPPPLPVVIESYKQLVTPILEVSANGGGLPYIHQFFSGPRFFNFATTSSSTIIEEIVGRIGPASFTPAAYDSAPSASNSRQGTIRSFSCTGGANGIPRINGGDIIAPAANYDNPDYDYTSPGYISGIAYTSGVTRPRIRAGFIEFPEPYTFDSTYFTVDNNVVSLTESQLDAIIDQAITDAIADLQINVTANVDIVGTADFGMVRGFTTTSNTAAASMSFDTYAETGH